MRGIPPKPGLEGAPLRTPPTTLVLEPTLSGALAPNPWLEDRVVAVPVPELDGILLAIRGVRFTPFPHGRFRYYRLPEWNSHIQFYTDTNTAGRTVRHTLQFYPAHSTMREICSPESRQVLVMHLRAGALNGLPQLPPIHQGPTDVNRVFPHLWSALTGVLERASLTESIIGMQRALLRDLAFMPQLDTQLIAAIEPLVTKDGLTAPAVLAHQMKSSMRNMQRRFLTGVGMPPKALSLIIRLRHSLARAAETEHPDWSQIALNHGFSDQAHLINTCTKHLGFPPGVFLRDTPTRMSLLDGAFLSRSPEVAEHGMASARAYDAMSDR